jgi:hypothetical protein
MAVKSYHRRMLAAGNLALRPARRPARQPGAPLPDGPAMSTLTAVAARTAATIRCLALGYVVVQVVIWRSFFAADPWRLAGPAAAVACAAVMVACLRRSRAPGWRVAGADTAVYVALALGALWCVPPPMRGDTANWLYISMAGQLLMPAWFAPTAAFVPLALASGAAYWAGVVVPMMPGSAIPAAAGNSPVADAIFLLTIAVVARCGLGMVRRRAATADAALVRADREAREKYVTLLRDVEGREHDRLLHDTVLNTLTALARPAGQPGDAAGRARLDVSLIESALGAADDLGNAADTASPGGRPAAPAGRDGGLLAAIAAAAAAMRRRGLVVHLDVAGRVADWAGAPVAAAAPLAAAPAPAEPLVLPGRVATALAQAAAEALANVARHAGTGEAWVAVELTEAGGVSVTVRDRGAGFDPGRVGPDRLGVRRSIVERVGDWGGRATVVSAPGAGTVVSLAWTADPAAPAW